jgi:hypothetical protein
MRAISGNIWAIAVFLPKMGLSRRSRVDKTGLHWN